MESDIPLISCPVRGVNCISDGCDGTLPLRYHPDDIEHEDGITRYHLVCCKGNSPYELPPSYTIEEIEEFEIITATPHPPKEEGKGRNSDKNTDSNNKKRPKRGRKGSGLHGKKTERMNNQLTKFRNFIKDHPIHDSDKTRTLGARAFQFWELHSKQMIRDSERIGERKGFSSYKSLANAYRNSK